MDVQSPAELGMLFKKCSRRRLVVHGRIDEALYEFPVATTDCRCAPDHENLLLPIAYPTGLLSEPGALPIPFCASFADSSSAPLTPRRE